MGRPATSAFFCLQFPTSGSLKFESRLPNLDFPNLDSNCHLPTPRSWVPPSTFWNLDSNFQIPTSKSWKLGVGNPTSNCRSPEVGFRFATSNRGKFPPCDENYTGRLLETTTEPVANNPSTGRGPPRVSTGVPSRRCSGLKTTVFRHVFQRAFLQGGVLRVFRHVFARKKY